MQLPKTKGSETNPRIDTTKQQRRKLEKRELILNHNYTFVYVLPIVLCVWKDKRRKRKWRQKMAFQIRIQWIGIKNDTQNIE